MENHNPEYLCSEFNKYEDLISAFIMSHYGKDVPAEDFKELSHFLYKQKEIEIHMHSPELLK